MTDQKKRDSEKMPHSRPGTVEQQGEDSFPASDSPAFSSGTIGAPAEHETPEAQRRRDKAEHHKKKPNA